MIRSPGLVSVAAYQRILDHQALRARLMRNYGVMFALLLVIWILKLFTDPRFADTDHTFLYSMRIGPLPWWVSLACVVALYFYLVMVVVGNTSRSIQPLL